MTWSFRYYRLFASSHFLPIIVTYCTFPGDNWVACVVRLTCSFPDCLSEVVISFTCVHKWVHTWDVVTVHAPGLHNDRTCTPIYKREHNSVADRLK